MTDRREGPNGDFEQFWQGYLRDHTKPLTRHLHFIGISIALAGIIVGLFVDDYGVIAVSSIVVGVAVLWAAHRFVERNTPTVHKRFGWATLCGARMYWLGITGRLKPELEKAGLS